MTEMQTETAQQADAEVALLLHQIEKESVPERVLDLAVKLQNALQARHAESENANQGA